MHAFDGRTDGRTDRQTEISSQDRDCIPSMQRGKNEMQEMKKVGNLVARARSGGRCLHSLDRVRPFYPLLCTSEMARRTNIATRFF